MDAVYFVLLAIFCIWLVMVILGWDSAIWKAIRERHKTYSKRKARRLTRTHQIFKKARLNLDAQYAINAMLREALRSKLRNRRK